MSLELLAIFGTSFVVGLSGALMPGPLVTLAIAESARLGFRRGPALVLGHAIVELAAVAGLLFGVSQVVRDERVAGAIGVVGGMVLVWMGYGMARSVLRGELQLEVSATAAQPPPAAAASTPGAQTATLRTAAAARQSLGGSPVLRGGAVTIANPYWLLWWATVGAAYVGRSLTLGLAGLIAFYVGHILSDLGWISLVSLVVASGRRALDQRVYRGVILFCAAILLLLGAMFLWSGAPQLLLALR